MAWKWNVIGIFVLLCSCMCDTSYRGRDSGHVLVVDEKSTGSSFECKTGEYLTIDMRNPGSGGYLVKEPEFDQKILQIQDQKTIPPAENVKKAGDFGRLIYTFKAIAPGSTDVVFRIYRPWEKDREAQDYLRMKVVVVR